MTSQKNEGRVVELLKHKISACSAEELQMESLRALTVRAFTVAPNGMGLQVQQLKDFVLEWEHFQKIIEKANQLGGVMYRYDVVARNSGRLGFEIPHDSMEGFIAGELLHIKDGTTVTRRSTYYSGILAWAGIVTLHKDEGKGSYISVNSEFRNI